MKNLITLLFLVFTANLFAQQEAHSLVDYMPFYKACEERTGEKDMRMCAEREMLTFINSHADYAKIKTSVPNAEVFVRFVVNVDGTLSEAFPLSKDVKLDEQSTAAIKKIFADMPSWVPGTHKGEKVPVALSIPMKF